MKAGDKSEWYILAHEGFDGNPSGWSGIVDSDGQPMEYMSLESITDDDIQEAKDESGFTTVFILKETREVLRSA